MSGWETYTIKTKWPTNNNSIEFLLDGKVAHKAYRFAESDPFEEYKNYIYCVNCYPFNTYQVDDKLEIDNSWTRLFYYVHHFDNTDSVRKILSPTELSTVISTSSELRAFVNEAQRNRDSDSECLILDANMHNNTWKYEKLVFNKYTGNFSYDNRR